MSDLNERRQRQRIVVGQHGAAAFRLECEGRPAGLRDLSLEGFSMQVSTPPDAEHEFDFRLEREGGGAVCGRARVVNYCRGATPDSGVAGCHIIALAAVADAQRLAQWLSEHVESVAAVPLSHDEAMAIVSGPSLV